MKKGFTLIELLAVIVILAIIALIATPITLNIIENVSENAAKQSALGYITAVKNQIVVNMIDKVSFNDSTYTIDQLSNKGVSVNGNKPDSGTVKIENSEVVEYSLKFGDYVVTYDGNYTTVVKESVDEVNTLPTMEEMCPGCVFAYKTGIWEYKGEYQTTLTSNQYKTNYQDVVNETGKNYFLGLKLNASNKIEKAYACGIRNGNPFCIEGSADGSTYAANKNILKAFYAKDYINLGEDDDESAPVRALVSKGYISSASEITSKEDLLIKADGICFGDGPEANILCYGLVYAGTTSEGVYVRNSSGRCAVDCYGYVGCREQ